MQIAACVLLFAMVLFFMASKNKTIFMTLLIGFLHTGGDTGSTQDSDPAKALYESLSYVLSLKEDATSQQIEEIRKKLLLLNELLNALPENDEVDKMKYGCSQYECALANLYVIKAKEKFRAIQHQLACDNNIPTPLLTSLKEMIDAEDKLSNALGSQRRRFSHKGFYSSQLVMGPYELLTHQGRYAHLLSEAIRYRLINCQNNASLEGWLDDFLAKSHLWIAVIYISALGSKYANQHVLDLLNQQDARLVENHRKCLKISNIRIQEAENVSEPMLDPNIELNRGLASKICSKIDDNPEKIDLLPRLIDLGSLPINPTDENISEFKEKLQSLFGIIF